MSNLSHKGDDHPDAAAKHLDDATALLAARRYDGAGYLSGYVVECSLKTVIIVQEIARHAGLTPATLAAGLAAGGHPISTGLEVGLTKARQASTSRSKPKTAHSKPKTAHDLENLSEKAVLLASQPGAAMAAYAPDPMPQPDPPALYAGAWSESLRYTSRGTVGPAMATAWVAEAKKVYQATVAKMRRDGVVF